mmetsp:Transcript_22240/g.33386  ORF Transcript_22240/g.33386 Transcript_22240/m.33386 type:complete len:260 (-) Transcript_22240:57-836(-)
MPRGVKKENLPSKVCVICNRPFTWRKKWENVWDEVTTCSKSCNRKRRSLQQTANRQTQAGTTEVDDGGEPFFELAPLGAVDGNTRSLSSALSLEQAEISTTSSGMIGTPPLEIHGIIADCSTDELHVSCQADEIAEVALEGAGNDTTCSGIDDDGDDDASSSPIVEYSAKQERKLAKKLAKAKRRAQREGRGDPSVGRKSCDVCSKSVDLLIRCTIDQTQNWNMVCGSCWKNVSGGVVDGDAAHPYYRYGGLWKNRKAK